jgi:hypothetical protein
MDRLFLISWHYIIQWNGQYRIGNIVGPGPCNFIAYRADPDTQGIQDQPGRNPEV